MARKLSRMPISVDICFDWYSSRLKLWTKHVRNWTLRRREVYLLSSGRGIPQFLKEGTLKKVQSTDWSNPGRAGHRLLLPEESRVYHETRRADSDCHQVLPKRHKRLQFLICPSDGLLIIVLTRLHRCKCSQPSLCIFLQQSGRAITRTTFLIPFHRAFSSFLLKNLIWNAMPGRSLISWWYRNQNHKKYWQGLHQDWHRWLCRAFISASGKCQSNHLTLTTPDC